MTCWTGNLAHDRVMMILILAGDLLPCCVDFMHGYG